MLILALLDYLATILLVNIELFAQMSVYAYRTKYSGSHYEVMVKIFLRDSQAKTRKCAAYSSQNQIISEKSLKMPLSIGEG